jgi:hypothetical protein
MSYSAKLNENTPLSILALEIRRLDDTLRSHTRNALRVALDEGEVLALAKSRVGRRKWKDWRKETCPNLTERTDVLYRRLAAFRARIEQELAVNPDLSIREAAKLISTPKPRSPKPKPAALEKWRVLSADEKREGLAADGIGALLEYMPPKWRDELADRVARVKHKTAQDRGLSARLREHIKLHPDDRLAKYVRDQGIDPKHVVVHVGAIDAPSKRRPPLVSQHAGSALVH